MTEIKKKNGKDNLNDTLELIKTHKDGIYFDDVKRILKITANEEPVFFDELNNSDSVIVEEIKYESKVLDILLVHKDNLKSNLPPNNSLTNTQADIDVVALSLKHDLIKILKNDPLILKLFYNLDQQIKNLDVETLEDIVKSQQFNLLLRHSRT